MGLPMNKFIFPSPIFSPLWEDEIALKLSGFVKKKEKKRLEKLIMHFTITVILPL